MREVTERHPKTKELMTVTHHIRAWRNHRNMTMDKLAEAAGLTPSMISQLELGRSRYTQQSLERIAAALDVHPGHLLLTEPEKASANSGFAGSDFEDSFWEEIPKEHHREVRVLFTGCVSMIKDSARQLWSLRVTSNSGR